MIYSEALDWLFRTQQFGIKLGLENVRRSLGELKVPGPNQRIIHVAGTNGKGSVCAMIDSICRAAGYGTGLFTSPHLVTYRERIRVDGEMINPDEVAQGLTTIRNVISSWEPHPTFFEITTALALYHFKTCQCELIVLETGLGGRLDATNAVTPIVSVITPISYDHEKWLGTTLDAIAGEKAGIIKAKVPVVSAFQAPAAANVLRIRAAECEAPLVFVTSPYTASAVGLTGKHQEKNAALAVAALKAGNVTVSEDAIARGLRKVEWPARFQRWDERIIIDGAHNPSGAETLAETWRNEFDGESATIILAVLRDKNFSEIGSALAPIASRFILPHIRTERALPPGELAAHLTTFGVPVYTTPSFSRALEAARADPERILITGSLHFAGEAVAFFRGDPAALEDCAQ